MTLVLEPVLSADARPIPGLWLGGGVYYAELSLCDGSPVRIALHGAVNLDQAAQALLVLESRRVRCAETLAPGALDVRSAA
jgi:hypothetical protein